MISLLRSIRSPAIEACHALALATARAQLWGQSGPRDFSRVAIVAAFARRNGITKGAELQYQALRRAGLDVEMVDATPALRNPLWRASHRPATCFIFHVGGPQTAWLVRSVLPAAANAWRIAYWAWELATPPQDWAPQTALVSEIWTPSLFCRRSLEQVCDVPVRVAPHHVAAVEAPAATASRPFTVLTMADSRSSFARKNPIGAVQAFRAAFGNSSAARMVVKLNGRPQEMAALAGMIGDSPNISVVTDYLDCAAMRQLYHSADVLLSLHRAEGFGLPMLEAMAHGVAVVATGWSGCMDFLTETNSLLLPYALVPVEDPFGVYRNGLWAEPSIPDAAAALRQLAADPLLRHRLAMAGKAAAAQQARLPLQEPPGKEAKSVVLAPAPLHA